jgi:hypothetical protein
MPIETQPLRNHYSKDLQPTNDLIKPALVKLDNFFTVIYPDGLPLILKNRWDNLNQNPENFIYIQESDENIVPDDPTTYNMVACYRPDTDKLIFKQNATEYTVIHEFIHFLSAEPASESTGFYKIGDVEWKYYLNEAFTNLITTYTYIDKPKALLDISATSDEINRIIARSSGFSDPIENNSRSYKLAYDKLTQILSFVTQSDTMHKLVDAYFATSLDTAMNVISGKHIIDFRNFDKKIGNPESVPLSVSIQNEFSNLKEMDLELFRNILSIYLPLKTSIINIWTQRENKLYRDITDILTRKQKHEKIKIIFSFPEMTPDGKGIKVVPAIDTGQITFILNTELFKLAEYLILQSPNDQESVLREAFRQMLISAADVIAKHTQKIVDTKLLENVKASFKKRISDNRSPNDINVFNLLCKFILSDPANTATIHLIRQYLGYNNLGNSIINSTISNITAMDNIYKMHHRLVYLSEISKKEIREQQKDTNQVKKAKNETAKKWASYNDELEKLAHFYWAVDNDDNSKMTENEYSKRRQEIREKYGFTVSYIKKLEDESNEIIKRYKS